MPLGHPGRHRAGLAPHEERVSPDGRRYFWAAGEGSRQDGDAESDFSLFQAGWVTLTPLTYELTDREGFSGKEFAL